MKYNYEREQSVITFSFILITFFIVIIVFCMKMEYKTYSVLNSVVNYDNSVEMIIDKQDYQKLKDANYIYINNKKIMFQIDTIVRDVIKRGKKKYHHIVIKLKVKEKLKAKESITIIVYNQKNNLLALLVSCFKEEV